jgi:hypothetical protein
MESLGKEQKEQKGQKEPTEYHCEKCDFKCCKKYNWERHLLTSKHTGEIIGKEQKEQKEQIYMCICGKKFQTNAGLWKHNKNCNQIQVKKDEPSDKELIMLLIKENSELRKEQTDIKELILEIVKNGVANTNTNNSHNNITNNNTNSHNKAFNLNFFLNETCKNAMNITDFINSIKPQLSDLIEVGEIGYVEGISKIIVKSLNNLDETIRPIHCTDKKRETFYVKDQGQWEKEDEQQKKIKKIIKNVANKNIDLLPQFREKYPEYSNSSSKISDKYDKMVVEVMETDPEKDNKIIRNISKVSTISH